MIPRDRVRHTTTTTGTGTLTLSSTAPTGYQTLAAAGLSGEFGEFLCTNGTDWERFRGRYESTGHTLTRTLVSSSTGALINWGAGSKDVGLLWGATSIGEMRRRELGMTGWKLESNVMPTAQYSGQTAIIGEYIYIFGGVVGGTQSTNIMRAHRSTPTVFTNAGNLNHAVYSAMMAMPGDGFVYIMGGAGDGGTLSTIQKAALTSPLTWVPAASTLHTAVQQSHYAQIGSTSYLFGGYTNAATTVTTIWSCPSNNTGGGGWTQSASVLPENRRTGLLFMVDDKIWICGGDRNAGVTANIMRASTSAPETWAFAGASAALPAARAYARSAVIGNRLYIFGGWNGSAYCSGVLSTDVRTPHIWTGLTTATGTEEERTPVPFGQTNQFIDGGRIYAAGGYINGANSTAIYSAPIGLFAPNYHTHYTWDQV